MENNTESDKFDVVVRRLLSVSHEEIQKRDAEWKRKRAAGGRDNVWVAGGQDNVGVPHSFALFANEWVSTSPKFRAG